MIRWRKRIRRLTYALTDVLCVFVSYVAVMQFFSIAYPDKVDFTFLEAIGFISMVAAFHILSYMIFSIYESTIENYGRLTPKLASEMGFAFAIVALFMGGATLFYMHASISRLFLAHFMILFYVLIMCNRIVLKRVSFKNMEKSLSVRNILVVGQSTKGLQYIREIEKHSYLNLRIAGYIHIKVPETYRDVPHLGGLDDLEEIVRDYVIDEIAVARPLNYDYRLFKLLDHCQDMGVTVSMLLETRNTNDTKAQVAMVGDLPVLKFHSVSLDEDQLFMKRVLDICGSLVGMVLFGIAYVVVAPLIKMESAGPVIFKQKRVGKNGRVFEIWKFRSMGGLDAEARKAALMSNNEMSGNMFKMTNDPRVTKIGAFIRKTSVDELPQFFNVLRGGDMSLVGTRPPPTIDEVDHYQRHHHKRISITPGITGKWQISGRSDIEDFEEIVRLDSDYIKEWTFWYDVKILLKTVAVVLKRRGSR